MTRVSIITPMYNSKVRNYILSSDSISKQTSKDFEWIIVDDGSEDPDARLASTIRLSDNFGPSVARNVGFQVSSGDIIAYLDMGDELAPDRVQSLISLYDEYQVQLSFAGYNIISPTGELQVFNHFNWIGQLHSAVDHINLLQRQNLSTPLGVSHRRKPFVEVGGFQRGIVCGEDGVMWRRMVDKIHPSEIVFVDEIAGNYYVTPDSQARTQRRFSMGGFAIDGDLKDNGKYLDESWYQHYSSKELYD